MEHDKEAFLELYAELIAIAEALRLAGSAWQAVVKQCDSIVASVERDMITDPWLAHGAALMCRHARDIATIEGWPDGIEENVASADANARKFLLGVLQNPEMVDGILNDHTESKGCRVA